MHRTGHAVGRCRVDSTWQSSVSRRDASCRGEGRPDGGQLSAHDDQPGHRRQEVREPERDPRSLLGLAARRHAAGVTLVATEATSNAWKPAFSLLEAEVQLLAANTGHLKNLPGPPDRQLDAVGLAKMVERASASPASGRHLLQAMITRQRDQGARPAGPGEPAGQARPAREALTGHVDDHHRFLCQRMLERIWLAATEARSPSRPDTAPLPRRPLPRHRQTPRHPTPLVAVGNSVLPIVWQLPADPRQLLGSGTRPLPVPQQPPPPRRQPDPPAPPAHRHHRHPTPRPPTRPPNQSPPGLHPHHNTAPRATPRRWCNSLPTGVGARHWRW